MNKERIYINEMEYTIFPGCIYTFWIHIKVTDKLGGNLIECLEWNDLPWEVRKKYRWYFKYRAALLQIKYPKYEIEMTWGSLEPESGNQKIRIHGNKLKAKKASITKCENIINEINCNLNKHRSNWLEVFPIEESPQYKNELDRLNNLELKLEKVKNELVELIQKGP